MFSTTMFHKHTRCGTPIPLTAAAAAARHQAAAAAVACSTRSALHTQEGRGRGRRTQRQRAAEAAAQAPKAAAAVDRVPKVAAAAGRHLHITQHETFLPPGGSIHGNRDRTWRGCAHEALRRHESRRGPSHHRRHHPRGHCEQHPGVSNIEAAARDNECAAAQTHFLPPSFPEALQCNTQSGCESECAATGRLTSSPHHSWRHSSHPRRSAHSRRHCAQRSNP